MASVAESDCHKDPNFAVICSFLDKYGETLGLPVISYTELISYLEDTTNDVSRVLIDIHVRLLRRIGKSSVSSERFEKSIIKFCHHFSEFDAWEVESYGYKHAKLNTKLRILKHLLECQFDFNIKFKDKVNESSAEDMRFLPVGRDKDGQAYWYFLDKDLNLLLYKEEQDDEEADTWQLVCSDRHQLANLVNTLQLVANKDVKEEEDDKTSSESRSSKEGSPDKEMPAGKPKEEQVEIKTEKTDVLKEEIDKHFECKVSLPKIKESDLENSQICGLIKDVNAQKKDSNGCKEGEPVGKDQSTSKSDPSEEKTVAETESNLSESSKGTSLVEKPENSKVDDVSNGSVEAHEGRSEGQVKEKQDTSTVKEFSAIKQAPELSSDPEAKEQQDASIVSEASFEDDQNLSKTISKDSNSLSSSQTDHKVCENLSNVSKTSSEDCKNSSNLSQTSCKEQKDSSSMSKTDSEEQNVSSMSKTTKDIDKESRSDHSDDVGKDGENDERDAAKAIAQDIGETKSGTEPGFTAREEGTEGSKGKESDKVMKDEEGVAEGMAGCNQVVGSTSPGGDDSPHKDVKGADKIDEKSEEPDNSQANAALPRSVEMVEEEGAKSIEDACSSETFKSGKIAEKMAQEETAGKLEKNETRSDDSKEEAEKADEDSEHREAEEGSSEVAGDESIDAKKELDVVKEPDKKMPDDLVKDSALCSGSETVCSDSTMEGELSQGKASDPSVDGKIEQVDTSISESKVESEVVGNSSGAIVEPKSTEEVTADKLENSQIVEESENQADRCDDVDSQDSSNDKLRTVTDETSTKNKTDEVADGDEEIQKGCGNEPSGDSGKNLQPDSGEDSVKFSEAEDSVKFSEARPEKLDDPSPDSEGTGPKNLCKEENTQNHEERSEVSEKLESEKSQPVASLGEPQTCEKKSDPQEQDAESVTCKGIDEKEEPAESSEKTDHQTAEESPHVKETVEAVSSQDDKDQEEREEEQQQMKENLQSESKMLDKGDCVQVNGLAVEKTLVEKDLTEKRVEAVKDGSVSLVNGHLSGEEGVASSSMTEKGLSVDNVTKAVGEVDKEKVGGFTKAEVDQSEEADKKLETCEDSKKIDSQSKSESVEVAKPPSHDAEKSMDSENAVSTDPQNVADTLSGNKDAGSESGKEEEKKEDVQESKKNEEKNLIPEQKKENENTEAATEDKKNLEENLKSKEREETENNEKEEERELKITLKNTSGSRQVEDGSELTEKEAELKKTVEDTSMVGEGTESKEKKDVPEAGQLTKGENEEAGEKILEDGAKSEQGKDTNGVAGEETESKKMPQTSESQRKLKRAAPEPGSDEYVESEPNGKRARQIAKTQRTRGGRNAAARGRAARLAARETESEDSETPVAPAAGRGRGGRGRRGRGRRLGPVGRSAKSAPAAAQENEVEGEDGASDQANGKRAKKKKPDSSSEAISEEEVPAKKGRNQIQPAGNKAGIPSGRGKRGGKAGRGGAKKSTAPSSPKAEEGTRRSARVRQMKARRPPTPSSPSEESEEEEEEEEDSDEETNEVDRDKDLLDASFTPEEEDSGDEDFKPKGRNFQRQAARTIKAETEEVVNDDTPCVKCGKYNHPEMILLCDKCDAGYHTACLRPPLMVIPDGDWFCPPCEHSMLVEKLLMCLQSLDNALKKKDRLVKRQERLAYVGISINNILHDGRQVTVSNKFDKQGKKIKEEGGEEEEEEEEEAQGSTSSYGSEEELPERTYRSERLATRQAQKRARHQKHKRRKPSRAQSPDIEVYAKRTCRTRNTVSYQFKEFDEMISNAIEDDKPCRREKPPVPVRGISRGKDMSNILGDSEEEAEKIRKRDGLEDKPPPVVKRKPKRRLTTLSDDEQEEDDDDESEEFKLSEEEDSDATEVEGEDAEEDEDLDSEVNSDSGDWKPRKTWYNSRATSRSSGRRGRKFVVDDDDDDYDSDENATKRRSTRNSTRGRIRYNDWGSDEEETGQETEEEEEASFSDFSSDDSRFARKMRKEKEKRLKEKEQAMKKKTKRRGKGMDSDEVSGDSYSDSSMVRKRKLLKKLVKKRRKDLSESEESGGKGRECKRGRKNKNKPRLKKKPKEYSDDDSEFTEEDDSEEEESEEEEKPRFKKKNILRSSDEEEKETEEEKDELEDKELPQEGEVKEEKVSEIGQEVKEKAAKGKVSKGGTAGTGNKTGQKGKKRGEDEGMPEGVIAGKKELEEGPAPGKMRRVSGSDKDTDGTVQGLLPESVTLPGKKRQPARRGRGQSREVAEENLAEKGAVGMGRGMMLRTGSEEKATRGGKKKKVPNFLDVPSGGEDSEEKDQELKQKTAAAQLKQADATGASAGLEAGEIPGGGPNSLPSMPQNAGQRPPYPQYPESGTGYPPYRGQHPPSQFPGQQQFGARGPGPYPCPLPNTSLPPAYPQGHMGSRMAHPGMSSPPHSMTVGQGPNSGSPPSSVANMMSGSVPARPHRMSHHMNQAPHSRPSLPPYPVGPRFSAGPGGTQPPSSMGQVSQGLEPGQIPPGSMVQRPQDTSPGKGTQSARGNMGPNPSGPKMGAEHQHMGPGMMQQHGMRPPPFHHPSQQGVPQGDGSPNYPPNFAGHNRMPYPQDMSVQHGGMRHPSSFYGMRSPPPRGNVGPQGPPYMGQYPPGMGPPSGAMSSPLSSMGQMAQKLGPGGMQSPPPTPPSSAAGVGERRPSMGSPPHAENLVKKEAKLEPSAESPKEEDLAEKSTQKGKKRQKTSGTKAKTGKGKDPETETPMPSHTQPSSHSQAPPHSQAPSQQSQVPPGPFGQQYNMPQGMGQYRMPYMPHQMHNIPQGQGSYMPPQQGYPYPNQGYYQNQGAANMPPQQSGTSIPPQEGGPNVPPQRGASMPPHQNLSMPPHQGYPPQGHSMPPSQQMTGMPSHPDGARVGQRHMSPPQQEQGRQQGPAVKKERTGGQEGSEPVALVTKTEVDAKPSEAETKSGAQKGQPIAQQSSDPSVQSQHGYESGQTGHSGMPPYEVHMSGMGKPQQFSSAMPHPSHVPPRPSEPGMPNQGPPMTSKGPGLHPQEASNVQNASAPLGHDAPPTGTSMPPQQGGPNASPQQGGSNMPPQAHNLLPQQGGVNMPSQGGPNMSPHQGGTNMPPQQGGANMPQQAGANMPSQQGGANMPPQGSPHMSYYNYYPGFGQPRPPPGSWGSNVGQYGPQYNPGMYPYGMNPDQMGQRLQAPPANAHPMGTQGSHVPVSQDGAMTDSKSGQAREPGEKPRAIQERRTSSTDSNPMNAGGMEAGQSGAKIESPVSKSAVSENVIKTEAVAAVSEGGHQESAQQSSSLSSSSSSKDKVPSSEKEVAPGQSSNAEDTVGSPTAQLSSVKADSSGNPPPAVPTASAATPAASSSAASQQAGQPQQSTPATSGTSTQSAWSGSSMGPPYHQNMGQWSGLPHYGMMQPYSGQGMMGPQRQPYMMGANNQGSQGGHPPGPVQGHLNQGQPMGGLVPGSGGPYMHPSYPGYDGRSYGAMGPQQAYRDYPGHRGPFRPEGSDGGERIPGASEERKNSESVGQEEEPGEVNVASKPKRAKTQKKAAKEGPLSTRGKGPKGKGRGRGGFMIDNLLQFRGMPGADEEAGEEGGEMSDIMKYVASDEFFKQQTSS